MAFDRRQLLNDDEETRYLMLEGWQSGVWTSFPAIVVAVNWAQMTVDVQPTIQGMTQDENGVIEIVNLPKLINCPILFPSAGGFTLTLPIQPNDEVLIHIATRCIDGWWELGGIQTSPEFRMHDLSDGFAFPGPKSLPKVISGISPTNAQLRTDAGTAYIELTPGGQINLVGNVNVTGTITASGEITSGSGPTAIDLTMHVHQTNNPHTPTDPPTPGT